MSLNTLKNEILEFIIKDIDETFLNKKDMGFSWEIYFKFNLWNKCNKILTDKLLEVMSGKNTEKNDVILAEIAEITESEIKNNEFQSKIDEIKLTLEKNGKLKKINFEEKEKEINDFFKNVRGIEFSILNDKEKENLLKHEDIMCSEKTIFNYLNITHMQYKYLYQKGYVLI